MAEKLKKQVTCYETQCPIHHPTKKECGLVYELPIILEGGRCYQFLSNARNLYQKVPVDYTPSNEEIN